MKKKALPGLRGRLLAALFPLLLLAFAPAASADVPTKFNYQGNLRQGGFLVSGTRDMVFRIFSSSTSMAPLWTSVTMPVSISTGVFRVTLEPTIADWQTGSLWLELEIEGVKLSPREEITSTPYSINTLMLSGKRYTNAIAAPIGAMLGDLWMDTTVNTLKIWNGNFWESISGAGAVLPHALTHAGTGGDPISSLGPHTVTGTLTMGAGTEIKGTGGVRIADSLTVTGSLNPSSTLNAGGAGYAVNFASAITAGWMYGQGLSATGAAGSSDNMVVISTGTSAVIRMTGDGTIYANKFIGDVSGAQGLPTGDNLGNHLATKALDMAGWQVLNVSSLTVTGKDASGYSLWLSSGVNAQGGTVNAGMFVGDGRWVNNLNASNLATGMVADARLSPNVVFTNTTQSIGGLKTFTSSLTVTSPYGLSAPAAVLAQNVSLSSASAAHYGGVYVSSHIFTPGNIYAGKIYGDVSGAIGLPLGDNLGNHTAVTNLNLAGFSLVNAASATFRNIVTVHASSLTVTGKDPSTGYSLVLSSGVYMPGGTVTAGMLVGDGRWLTSLNASSLASGTAPDARLSANVVLANTAQTISGVKTFGSSVTVAGASGVSASRLAMAAGVELSSATAAQHGGVYVSSNLFVNGRLYGDGSGLSGISGDNLGNHTASQNLNLAGFSLVNAASATFRNIVTVHASSLTVTGKDAATGYSLVLSSGVSMPAGTVNAGMFVGNGQWLTGLNASNLATGTVPDARLSGNVVFANTDQTITGVKTFSSSVTVSGSGLVDAKRLALGAGVEVSSNTAARYGGVFVSSNIYVKGKIYGDGSGLSGISGDNLGNHTAAQDLNLAGFSLVNAASATFRNGVTVAASSLTVTGKDAATGYSLWLSSGVHAPGGTVEAGLFVGDGRWLTGLNASSLASGTVPDARLSANVVLADSDQTIGGSKTFGSSVTVAGAGLVDARRVVLGAGVEVSSNTAARYGGVYVSSNLYVNGKLYGDGSTLSGLGGTLSGGQAPRLPYWTAPNSLGNSVLSQDAGGMTVTASTFSVQGRDAAGYSLWLSSGLNMPAGTVNAGAVQGDGSGLTGLNASALASGTAPDARLSANVVLANSAQNISGLKTYTSSLTVTSPFGISSPRGQLAQNVSLSSASAAHYGGVYVSSHIYTPGNIYAGKFYGDISGASGLPSGDNLGDHTAVQNLNMAGFSVVNAASATFRGAVTVNASSITVTGKDAATGYSLVLSSGIYMPGGTVNAGTVVGDGRWLTALNASALASGTLADARLSSNVDLLDADQTLTGAKTFASPVAVTAESGVAASRLALAAGVEVSSNTAAQYGGVYVSSNLYVNGKLYGDGSTLSGLGGTLSGGQTPRLAYWTAPNALGNASLTQDAGGLTVVGGTLTVQGSAFSVGGSTLAAAGGRVGVGTGAPGYLLHISSGAGVAGTLVAISTGSADVIRMTGDGTIYANKFVGDVSGAVGLPVGDNLGNHTATTDLNMAGRQIVNVSSASIGGWLGLGTAVPQARLQISSGAGEAGDMVLISTGSSNVIRMTGDGTIYANKFVGDVSGAVGLPVGDNLGNHTATTDLNMAGRRIVNVSSASIGGWLGLGTAAPQARLHVSSGAGEAGDMVVVSTGGASVFRVTGDGGVHASLFYGDGSGLSNVAVQRDSSLAGSGTAAAPLGLTGQGLALHNLASSGLVARTGAGTVAAREIKVNASGRLSVANGTGVAGDPTLDVVEANLALDNIGGMLSLPKGGTGADLSGAANGALLYKSGSSLAPTGALTGVLKGNGAAAPSAMTGAANLAARWTDAATLGTGVLADDGSSVGVGTSAPAYLLHVAAAPGTAGNLLVVSTGAADVVRITGAGEVFASKFIGDASLLTNVPGDNLGNHTATQNLNLAGRQVLNVSSLTVTGKDASGYSVWLSSGLNMQGGTVNAGMFVGDGRWVSDLNASSLASGTVPDARLSANVDLLDADQTVSGVKTFGSSVTVASASGLASARLRLAPGVEVSSTGAANYGGVYVSTNLYVNGKLYGDASQLTNVPGDNWGSQAVQRDTTLTGNGTAALPLGLTGQGLALHNFASAGLMVRTGAAAFSARSVAAGSAKVTVADGDGVAGNPTVDVSEADLTLDNLGGTLSVPKGGTGATTLTGILKGNGAAAVTAVTGTQHYAARWTDANTLGTGALYDNGTNVGVGTNDPLQKLQVAGDINIESGSGVRIANTAAAGTYLRGDGTRYAAGTIQAADLPAVGGTPALTLGTVNSAGTASTYIRTDDTILAFDAANPAALGAAAAGSAGVAARRDHVHPAADLAGASTTGILPLNKGGTNKNLTAVNGGLVWSDADSLELTASLTGVLKGNGANAPSAMTGTQHYAVRWLDAETLGTGVLYDNASRAGVGTAAPDQLFTVAGNISQTGVLISSGAGKNYFAGSVGIGASDPLQKLQVAGDINIESGSGVRVNNTAASGTFLRGDGTRYAPGTIQLSDLPGQGGTPALTLGTANTPGSAATYIRTDDTILAFDAVNPAALGTAAAGSAGVAARRDHVHPAADLAGTSTTGILPLNKGGTSKNLSAVNGGLVWSDADSLEITAAMSGVLKANGANAPTAMTGTQHYVTRWTANDALGTGVLYDNGTRAGVGNTSPDQEFSVAGDVSLTGTVISSGAGSSYFAGNFGLGTAAPAYKFHDTGDAYIAGQEIVGGTLTVQGNAFSVGGSTLAVAGGRVGVGTSNPLQKLQVAGDINIESGSGVRINNSAAAGTYLRGDGTRFAQGAIQAADLPSLGGTPGLTLGTANSAGTASTYIRTDDTILAFDAVNPAALGTAAAGSAGVAARRDHVHPAADLGTAQVTGVLTLNKGGTNKNLTAVNGGLVWSDADSMEITAALTGVLKANGAAAPTAMTGTQHYAARWTDANTLGTGALYDNGTNVGIGNSGPAYKLHVTGDVLATGQEIVGGTLTVQGNAFSVGRSTLAVVAGNVGIGSGSPQATLHLVSSVTINGLLVRMDKGTGNPIVRISDVYDAGVMEIGYSGLGSGRAVINGGSSGVGASIGVHNAAGTLTGVINSNGSSYFTGGSLGVGTNNPLQKLQVAGDINIESGSGVRINNTAAAGTYLRGDGTRFAQGAIQAADLPSLGGTPGLTLGTANSAGTASTYIRTDDTILAFDAVNPAALGTAAAGSAGVAARRDHVHPAADLAGTSTTGILPLNKGGTNKNLTAVNGGLVWSDADSMEITAALTGVLKGNGTGAPTAMTGTQNYAARWTDANTLGTGALYDNSSRVGVGTAAPDQELTVAGDVSLTGTVISSGAGNSYFAGSFGLGTAAPAYKFHNTGASYIAGQEIVGGTLTVQGSSLSVAGVTLTVGGGNFLTAGRFVEAADFSKPVYTATIYGGNGDLPFRTTANAPVTMRYVYGPFSGAYGMPACPAGTARNHKLYAEFVDNISGAQHVYLRLAFDGGATRDFDMGATNGASPSFRTYVSAAFTEANANHANVQVWVSGASGPYAELRKAELRTFCTN